MDILNTLLLVVVIVFCIFLLVAVLKTLFTVRTYTAGVVERFGKFNRIVRPGLHVLIPFAERAFIVDLQVKQAQFSVETVVWPVGTWESEVSVTAVHARRRRPDARGSAPRRAGPRARLAERDGDRDGPGRMPSQPASGLVEEVTSYCAGHAIPIALEHHRAPRHMAR